MIMAQMQSTRRPHAGKNSVRKHTWGSNPQKAKCYAMAEQVMRKVRWINRSLDQIRRHLLDRIATPDQSAARVSPGGEPHTSYDCSDQDKPIIAYIDFMLISSSGPMNLPKTPVTSNATRISMP